MYILHILLHICNCFRLFLWPIKIIRNLYYCCTVLPSSLKISRADLNMAAPFCRPSGSPYSREGYRAPLPALCGHWLPY